MRYSNQNVDTLFTQSEREMCFEYLFCFLFENKNVPLILPTKRVQKFHSIEQSQIKDSKLNEREKDEIGSPLSINASWFFSNFYLGLCFCLKFCRSISLGYYLLLQHMYVVVNKYIACRPIENITALCCCCSLLRCCHRLHFHIDVVVFETASMQTLIYTRICIPVVCSSVAINFSCIWDAKWEKRFFCSCLWSSSTSSWFNRFVVTSIAVVIYLTMPRKLQ